MLNSLVPSKKHVISRVAFSALLCGFFSTIQTAGKLDMMPSSTVNRKMTINSWLTNLTYLSCSLYHSLLFLICSDRRNDFLMVLRLFSVTVCLRHHVYYFVEEEIHNPVTCWHVMYVQIQIIRESKREI